ncbi:hypothetical protein LCGC14_0467980 [marine sediment metagenome]|uniref:MalT-like TPR region domain-containing protein n=1 Tax=marine sediment metagenome TaxID=412755 RepID=A0A0F9UZX2_9ZZZZ|nr:hypothetical protein [Methylophaga sp.]HEC58767.1 hypothetical protein [Methylophaga sp.]
MDAWKRMIIEGNQSFNTGRFYSAENYYKIACDFASNMQLDTSRFSDVIASLVVSYQNLAELYFKNKQSELALSQYQVLHEKLIGFITQQQSPEFVMMIQKAIRKIGTELLFLTKKEGIDTLRSKQVLAKITAIEKVKLH